MPVPKIMEPPMPMKAMERMNMFEERAKPENRDARVKRAMPQAKTFFLP